MSRCGFLYIYFKIVVRSFIHSTQFFVPNVFCTETGFPCHRIEKFIRVRRTFGLGLGSSAIVEAKCFANVSELCFLFTSSSTSANCPLILFFKVCWVFITCVLC